MKPDRTDLIIKDYKFNSIEQWHIRNTESPNRDATREELMTLL